MGSKCINMCQKMVLNYQVARITSARLDKMPCCWVCILGVDRMSGRRTDCKRCPEDKLDSTNSADLYPVWRRSKRCGDPASTVRETQGYLVRPTAGMVHRFGMALCMRPGLRRPPLPALFRWLWMGLLFSWWIAAAPLS